MVALSSLLTRLRPYVQGRDDLISASGASLTAGPLIDEYHDIRFNRTIVSVGLVGLLAFFLVIALTPVHEVATGTGEILPVGLVQTVEHLEGGRVSNIYVEEGDRVRAGDPIVALDPVAIQAELEKARTRLAAVEAELSRQKWGVSEQGLSFASNFTLRGGISSVAGEITPVRADDNFRQAQLDVIAASIAADEAAAARYLELQDKEAEKLKLASERLSDFDKAFKLGAVSKQERDAVMADKLDSETSILQLQSQYLEIRSRITSSKAKYQELRAEFQQAAASGVAEREAERKELIATVTQLEDRLMNLTVRSPSDGVINQLAANNIGQVVLPGAMVAEVVPKSDKLFAEIEVPGDQIGFLAPGMPAKIKVLPYDYTRFGEIDAIVSDISASSLRRENEEGLFYRVKLAIDRDYLGASETQMRLSAGMPIVTDIVVHERSVLSYLLKPMRAVSDRAFTEQ